MNTDRTKKPTTGSEQDSPRATSGGGLGQGREMAAGMPKDMEQIGRPGKNAGGSDGSDNSASGKRNGLPGIADHLDPNADPKRSGLDHPRVVDDGGLAEDDPDGETRE